MKILGYAAKRRAPRRGHVVGRQRPLDLGEVGRPVAEREHEAKPENGGYPVGPERVVAADPQPLPGVQSGLPQIALLDLVGQPAEAADVDERDGHERGERRQDDEELQDLVVDRGGEPAEGDVGEHDRRRHEDRGAYRPPQHEREHETQREQVHPADEHGRQGKGDRVEEVGGAAVTPAQPLGHRTDLRPVVEGHHHQPEEDHRRDRADPIEVHRGHAVLRAVAAIPRTSRAPRLAAMKASPVIHAGSERPERKKSRSVFSRRLAPKPIPSTTTK
jgi:hypothetical protein